MVIKDKNLKELKRISQRNADSSLQEKSQLVEKIILAVKEKGDEALAQYSKEFDKVEYDLSREKPFQQQVDIEEKPYFNALNKDLQEALSHAKNRIEEFHRHEIKNLKSQWSFTGKINEELGIKLNPIDSVAIYVPGGQAALVSTVLMTAIPAQAAAVKRIILFSPPKINTTILACAELLGIEEVIGLGGAQAIAAAAYGSQSIKAVDKIVGPGNIFVSLAKKSVFGKVGIDGIFGPSELAVIADDNAKANYIAADLLSQLEHGSGLESVLLVSQSTDLLKAVEKELDKQINQLETKSPEQIQTIKTSLKKWSAFLQAENLEESVAIINEYAPEHLELQVDNPQDYIAKVNNAGAIFIGENSCESLGDYLAGPSHCLPTAGSAKFSSGLQASDFLKKTSIINFSNCDKSSNNFQKLRNDVQLIAQAENLEAHAKAMKLR